MIVERNNNEIVVRLPATMRAAALQGILDYLRFEELTSGSIASQEDADQLIAESKKGRLKRIHDRLKGNDQSGR